MKNTRKAKTEEKEAKKSNLVKKMTLEVLNERHNALARYMGIPCVVEATELLNGAVMSDGSVGCSKDFACYRVDLKPFKGDFSRIRFRAASNGKDVVLGHLVDKNGNIEAVATTDKSGIAQVTLPLSNVSNTLFATMPAKNGKPKWKNITVELLCDGGVIGEVNTALNTLLGMIRKLEKRVEEIADRNVPQVEIALA